jgi:transmembrane sensor
MLKGRESGGFNAQIYAQAADWLVRERAQILDKAGRRDFDAWLRASPEHVRAFFEMSAIWEDSGGLDDRSGTPAAKLIESARCDEVVVPIAVRAPFSSVDSPVIEAKRPTGDGPGSKTGRPPGPRLRIAASAAALCLSAGALLWATREPSYSTGIGQQRSITLSDGSTVQLNARSEIRVHFVKYDRDVDLVRGQALFHVVKDAARPFIVRAGRTQVQVVGTQFDINESHAGTIVTVVEGRVAVFGPKSALASGIPANRDAIPSHGEDSADLLKGLSPNVQAIFVSAGEQVTVTSRSLEETVLANVASAIAWTHRRFVFDAAPLAEVVDEFNRYNVRQLVVNGPQLSQLRINAVFSSSDPSVLIRFLRAQPDVKVSTSGAQILISAR